ncbi:MAG: hypothetical protein V4691_04985 [Pseudomonadota bacterium]
MTYQWTSFEHTAVSDGHRIIPKSADNRDWADLLEIISGDENQIAEYEAL